MSKYSPPYKIIPETVNLLSEISELVGHLSAENVFDKAPYLRKSNRIKSIQSSLAIENNSLSLDQVTDIINGKRVVGDFREIQEVKNAFEAYNMLEKLNPFSEKDLLKAHKILMTTLMENPGKYRSGGVGIIKGSKIIHVAPPAENVPYLMNDLFQWIAESEEHLLIKSSVFHYEFEFIHPFLDGNGRMGRLWQTLILSKWKDFFMFLPLENLIKKRQQEYYNVLGASDRNADSTEFIVFILRSIKEALLEIKLTDQDSDQVTDQVKLLAKVMNNKAVSANELMKKLNLTHRPSFRSSYLHPAIKLGFIEMTLPEKPNSRNQKYRLTSKGFVFKQENE